MTEQIESEASEQPTGQMTKGMEGGTSAQAAPFAETRSNLSVSPQMGAAGCSCGGAAGMAQNGGGIISYVYAIGRVEARFPNLAAEKEFAQATGRAGHRRQNRSAGLP